MRVTSDAMRATFLAVLERANRQLMKTQTQIGTGRRVNAPSDDSFAAARITEIDAAIARLAQFRDNGTLARNRLSLEETVLADVADNLQRIRELTLQANNATLGNGERAGLAAEIRERFDGLLALANSVDGNGRYLFAGFSEGTQPFVVTADGSVEYRGDSGQRYIEINDERRVAINDAGDAAFQRIPSGNGTFSLSADPANTGSGVLGAGTVIDPNAWVPGEYRIEFVSAMSYEVRDAADVLVASGEHTPGSSIEFFGIGIELNGTPAAGDTFVVEPSTARDVFTVLNDLLATLGTSVNDESSRAALHNGLGQTLVDLDRAIDHVIDLRATIGARLRAVEDEVLSNEAFEVQMTRELSDLRDLDYAEAISLLSQQLLQIDAAQKAFSRTQGLSLFRYL
jgi:flagellar hook-associated protein 3 FlgL